MGEETEKEKKKRKKLSPLMEFIVKHRDKPIEVYSIGGDGKEEVIKGTFGGTNMHMNVLVHTEKEHIVFRNYRKLVFPRKGAKKEV